MAPPPSLLLEAIVMDMEVMDSRAEEEEQDEEEGEEEKDETACGGTGGSGPFLLVDVKVVKSHHNKQLQYRVGLVVVEWVGLT